MAPRRAQTSAHMPIGSRHARFCSVVLGGSAQLAAAIVLVYGVRMSVVVVVLLGRQVGSVALVESRSRQTSAVCSGRAEAVESVLVMMLLLFAKYWRNKCEK